MDDMKLYYEASNGDITLFLEVKRDLWQIWEEREIGLRGFLSDKLKKIYFGKEEDRHIEGKLGDISRQYHLYKGSNKGLKDIIDYCKVNDISVEGGFGGYLKRLIPSRLKRV